MKLTSLARAWTAILFAIQAFAQSPLDVPHLRKQRTATQLIVDGRPSLAPAGESGNNTATSLENMKPLRSRLTSGNLNCVLPSVPMTLLSH